MNASIAGLINIIVIFATDYLMLFLLISFCLAVVLRVLITVIITRQKKFVLEFCKRVHHYNFMNPQPKGSFYSLVKRILATTYFENFNLRAKYMRRNGDQLMSVYDRIFLVQDGIIRLINDFLKHVIFLHKDSRHQPNFTEITANSFASNPVFNRVLGIFSMSRTNEILNILPGIFIVAGIFGTFLGIMSALPELTNMDIGDAAASKVVIDAFLISISFALTSSILGIVLSVLMTFINTILSPENTYMESIDSFKAATEILWNKCEDNVTDNSDTRSEREKEAEDALEAAIANMYAKYPSPEMGPRENGTVALDDVTIAETEGEEEKQSNSVSPLEEKLETKEKDLEGALTEEARNLKEKVEDLTSQQGESQNRLASLEDLLKTNIAEKKSLENHLSEQANALESKNQELLEQQAESQNRLTDQEMLLSAAVDEKATLEKAFAKETNHLESKFEELSVKHVQSTADLTALEDRLKEGAAEKAAIENAGVAEHDNLKENYACLQTECDTKQSELDALERKLEFAAVKIVQLEKTTADSLEEMATRSNDLQDDYDRKRSETEKLNLAKIRELQSQQDESQNKLLSLESQLEETAGEKVTLQKTFTEETENLEGKLLDLTVRYDESQAELSLLRDQLQNGTAARAALENAQSAELKNLELKYAGLQEEYDKKQRELDTLEGKLRDDAGSIVELGKVNSDNFQAFSIRSNDMEVDYARECSEEDELDLVDIQTLWTQEEEMQKTSATLESLLKEVTEEKELIQNTFYEETNSLVGNLQDLTARINERQAELGALGEQMGAGVEVALQNAGEAEIISLEEKYAGLEGEYEKKEKEVAALRAELEAGVDEIAELEKTNAENLEELENRLKALEVDYAESKKN